MAKKHDFFDSGLLYQFCINFRRRRRLSELLNESEQDNVEGIPVSTPEGNHPDSPFVLRKDQPQESNTAFQSGKTITLIPFRSMHFFTVENNSTNISLTNASQ